ncbi:hypothetical protein DFP72DRAFT_1139990 [Ephemerocybe angulata]|uniref:Uncharacterized protein n=1 Tax=Ephemerocybe angulata TaxID=980116 RepID=A0A8H6M2M6_9AGAR|nr:hypothetical protein DFP72DRAFT_1139990 [Tulosesus angulatus]
MLPFAQLTVRNTPSVADSQTRTANKEATEPERLVIRSNIMLKRGGIIPCCLPPPCRRPQSPIAQHPSRRPQRRISSATCRARWPRPRSARSARTAAPPGLRTSDARLGSPSSIPSSPTFIHPFSAILERDIESLLLPPSPPNSANRPLDPRRIPRNRGAAQL